jgi:hypothetical protein
MKKLLMQTLFEKSTMNFFSRIGTVAVLMLLASAPAAVADIYNFMFTSSGMNATGTIDIVGGVAQSGSIYVTGVPLEANPSMFTTAAGDLLTAGGDVRDHDGDVITYDTVANPSNDPIFDSQYGVAFGSGYYGSDGGTPEYNTVINLWGNSPGSYGLFVGEAELDGNGNVVGNPEYVYAIQNGSLTLTPVPEPGTLVLLGMGGFGLLAYAWRRR